MDLTPKNHLLKFPSDAIQEIRKIHNLDKPGRMEEAVDILEQWIKRQDHILKKDFDRHYLERVLIASKGSVEKAKKQIDRLCTLKTLLPQYFTTTNVKLELQLMLELAWLVPLPVMTEDFCRVLVIKINNKLFSEKHFLDYYKYNIVLCEYLKAHDYNNGFIIVNDYQETDIFEIMKKLNTIQLQQFMTILTKGFASKASGIHVLTDSKIIETLIKMIKPFMSQKMGDRIRVHRSLDELHKIIPKDILPVEYGGKERSIIELRAEWIEALSSDQHVEYMTMMNKACTNESLRSTDKFNQEYMGIPGSFRNLGVD